MPLLNSCSLLLHQPQYIVKRLSTWFGYTNTALLWIRFSSLSALSLLGHRKLHPNHSLWPVLSTKFCYWDPLVYPLQYYTQLTPSTHPQLTITYVLTTPNYSSHSLKQLLLWIHRSFFSCGVPIILLHDLKFPVSEPFLNRIHTCGPLRANEENCRSSISPTLTLLSPTHSLLILLFATQV